jgi:hypothetical protein
MKSIILGLTLAGAVAISGRMAQGASINVYSTGVVSPGVPNSDGSTDLHYILTGTPPSTPVGSAFFITDQGGFPFPIWVADDNGSKWISPQRSYASGESDPVGTFIYHTTFSLAGLIPSTASLVLQLATDNAATDVLLNGISTGISYSSYTNLSSPFTISSGFGAGVNTLDFVVQNFSGNSDNPVGLRVLISGNADLVPEPASAGLALLAAGFAAIRIARRQIVM